MASRLERLEFPFTAHGHCVGRKRTPTYYSWRAMRKRCKNPREWNYQYYGALGIRVCARWDRFASFLEDMGERPKGCTLDRVDAYGDYEPANCRWAKASTQQRNKRVSVRKVDYAAIGL